MRTKRKMILAGLMIAGVFSFCHEEGQAQSRLSFEEALKVARGNSHVLKQSGFLGQQREAEQKAAKGLYFPSLSLNADYLQMSDNLHLDLTSVKDAITPIYQVLSNYGVFSGVPNPDPATNKLLPVLPQDASTTAVRGELSDALKKINSAQWDQMIQKKSFGTVSAGLTWPIYTGGKIDAANKAAKFQVDEVKEEDRQKQGEIISELAERYFGLVLAQQASIVRKEVLDGMESHLTDAEKMQQQGMIANAEVLHAKVFQAQAEREKKKADRDIVILNRALLNTLAVKEESEKIDPSSSLFYLETLESADYYKKLALKSNPMLNQVEIRKELAHQNTRAQQSSYYPTLALMGSYNIVDKDLSSYAPDWVVGVGLKWTLFDGAARSKKLQAAKYMEDQVQEASLKAKDDVCTVIDKLYQELMMNVEQLQQLKNDIRFAEEYLRVKDKAFKEGMSNSTEVVDARLNLAKSKIEQLQVAYQYDVDLAKLLQFAGIPEQYVSYQNHLEVIKMIYNN